MRGRHLQLEGYVQAASGGATEEIMGGPSQKNNTIFCSKSFHFSKLHWIHISTT
jgi:hypothetical protein